MAVRYLDRVARLRQRQLDARRGDPRIRCRRKRHLNAELLEVAVPERQVVEDRHRARQTHAQLAGHALEFRGAERMPGDGLEQALPQREQVFGDRLAPRRRGLAELVRTLVAPEALLPFDGEFLDVAEVRAGLADEVARRHREPREIVAPELRLPPGGQMPLPRNERHPDRAHHAVIRRHRDFLAEHLGEGRGHGIVVGRAALEVDHLADLAAAHHAIQVVESDRVGQARDDVRHRFALEQPARDVALHENRAALAERRGRGGRKRQLRELAFDADAELFRLLFEEGTGARRAGLVHREIDHDAVLDRNVLRVLPADLENRIHRLAAQRTRYVQRAGLVGRDFVVHDVGAHQLGDQFPAGTGRSHALDHEARSPLALHLAEPLLHRLDRPAGGAQVNVLDHHAVLVGRDYVGRDRADVDAEVGGDRPRVRRRRVVADAMPEQHHVVHRERTGVLRRALRSRAGSACGHRAATASSALRLRGSRCRWRRTRHTARAPAARSPGG